VAPSTVSSGAPELESTNTHKTGSDIGGRGP
jgi:hypothetical protein